MADISKIKVDTNVYAIKSAETYSKAATTSIAISSTTHDDVMRRDIAGGSGSWSSTYVPTAGFDKQFLLVFVNTSTSNALTITHPTTGYNKVVNLYGSPTLIIPAGKTGEVAVTIGKDSANATYMSFTCQLQDSATDPAFINAVVQQVGGRFVPLTGTIAGSPVTGNITTNKALIFDDRAGSSSDQGIIYNNGGELVFDASDSGNMNLNVDGGMVFVNGELRTSDGLSTQYDLTVDGDTTIHDVYPYADLQASLGASSLRFATGHFGTVRSEQVFASGGIYESSDIRLKDVKGDLDLDKAYDLVDKCQTILYSLKADETDKIQLGLIAQEVKEIFPEIINEDKNGMLSVDYSRLTVIILKVLKDLIKRISDLERR